MFIRKMLEITIKSEMLIRNNKINKEKKKKR